MSKYPKSTTSSQNIYARSFDSLCRFFEVNVPPPLFPEKREAAELERLLDYIFKAPGERLPSAQIGSVSEEGLNSEHPRLYAEALLEHRLKPLCRKASLSGILRRCPHSGQEFLLRQQAEERDRRLARVHTQQIRRRRLRQEVEQCSHHTDGQGFRGYRQGGRQQPRPQRGAVDQRDLQQRQHAAEDASLQRAAHRRLVRLLRRRQHLIHQRGLPRRPTSRAFCFACFACFACRQFAKLRQIDARNRGTKRGNRGLALRQPGLRDESPRDFGEREAAQRSEQPLDGRFASRFGVREGVRHARDGESEGWQHLAHEFRTSFMVESEEKRGEEASGGSDELQQQRVGGPRAVVPGGAGRAAGPVGGGALLPGGLAGGGAAGAAPL